MINFTINETLLNDSLDWSITEHDEIDVIQQYCTGLESSFYDMILILTIVYIMVWIVDYIPPLKEFSKTMQHFYNILIIFPLSYISLYIMVYKGYFSKVILETILYIGILFFLMYLVKTKFKIIEKIIKIFK